LEGNKTKFKTILKCGVSTLNSDKNKMKKNYCFGLIGAIILTLLFMSACSTQDEPGDDNNDSTTKKEPTLLQVEAEISRNFGYSNNERAIWVLYYVSVSYNGAQTNDAVVTVNGINVPRIDGFTDGWYELSGFNSETPTYIPTNTYTVSVTFGGITYTETLQAPGGFTANADYSQVQWEKTGSSGLLSVAPLFGETTYCVPKTTPSILTSPQTIPSTAFPTSGTYVITLIQQNITEKTFGALSGYNCYLKVQDAISWRITK